MFKKQTFVLRIVVLLMGVTLTAAAQLNGNPMAPVGPEGPKQSDGPAEPPAPLAQVTNANPFPAVNPRMFTAALPTQATVESFLKALWGYDVARIWSVAAIEKTMAPGVSRVTVLVGNRRGGSLQRVVFFVLPDQKHVIADQMLPFGPEPFAEMRKTMQDRADGPAQGAAGKDLLLVEFGDLQCPRCKEAQTTMSQLAKDFPQARIVFEDVPVDGHPASYQAAAYGVCVAQHGSDAFSKYVQAVYDNQEGLTSADTEKTLNAAVVQAGQEPSAISACAETQTTKDTVAAAVRLGQDVGVDQTPVLFINGRMVPLSGPPYEAIKSIVLHRAQMDGVSVPVPVPHLSTLQ